MHIEEIRDYCLSLNGATEEMPFGPDTLVFKVAGKVFLLVGLDDVEFLRFNVKCDPDYAIELRSRYEGTVIPGWHMNKKHWNTVYCNRALSDDFLRELMLDSYKLIVQSLPKSVREQLSIKRVIQN